MPGRGEFARAQVHDGDEGLVEGLLEAGVLKEALIDLRRIFGVELRRLVATGAWGVSEPCDGLGETLDLKGGGGAVPVG